MRVLLNFFFNDTATTEIYTLSLHDALPILLVVTHGGAVRALLYHVQQPSGHFWDIPIDNTSITEVIFVDQRPEIVRDRKSTRLNSSHANISYAVFCLKKKNASFSRWLMISS